MIPIKFRSIFNKITHQHEFSPVNLLHVFRISFLWTPLEGCFCSEQCLSQTIVIVYDSLPQYFINNMILITTLMKLFFPFEFPSSCSSSTWCTLKIATSDFLAELEQQIKEQFAPSINIWFRKVLDNLKQKLGWYELYLLKNFVIKLILLKFHARFCSLTETLGSSQDRNGS